VGLSTDKEQVELSTTVAWPTILMKLELPARMRPEDLNGGLCKGEDKDLVADLSGETEKWRLCVPLGAERKCQCKSSCFVTAGNLHLIAITF